MPVAAPITVYDDLAVASSTAGAVSVVPVAPAVVAVVAALKISHCTSVT